MDQANLWEVVLQHEENEEERPIKGWKIYESMPSGLQAITSRRGKQRKYKNLSDAFSWLSDNKSGYCIVIKCFGYTGTLNQELNA